MIFFDLDNTLIDHHKGESIAVLKLCEAFQVKGNQKEITDDWRDISKKYYTQYLSKTISFEEQRILRIREFFSKFNAIDPSTNEPLIINSLSDGESEKIFDLYLYHYESNWCIFDDVLPLLEALNSRKLGIITNGQTNQQLKKLESAGIKKYFSLIITSHDAGASKPDSKLFSYAAQKAELPIQDCHYIGDDFENDAVAAHRSGMHGYWINREKRISSIPSEVHVLNSLSDAINLFHIQTSLLKRNENKP